MDCETVREQYGADLVTGVETPGDVARHLRQCEHCREDLAGLLRTWAALGQLPLAEPSPALARRLHRRIRWRAASETLGSWQRWQPAALAGVLGFVASVLLSLLLPYDAMVALCRAAAPSFLPGPVAYLMAGLVYGVVPMALAGGLSGRGRRISPTLDALDASLVFLVVLAPYLIARCSDFPGALLAGFLLGVAAGGFGGAAGGIRLARQRARA